MIYRIIFSIFTIFLFSCKSKNAVPSDVLKPAKMQDVMWDMIRADQLSQEVFLHDSTKKVQPENLSLYNKVFQVHKISRKDFELSYAFYQKHPEMFRTIFDSIHAKQSREIQKQDSILQVLPKANI